MFFETFSSRVAFEHIPADTFASSLIVTIRSFFNNEHNAAENRTRRHPLRQTTPRRTHSPKTPLHQEHVLHHILATVSALSAVSKRLMENHCLLLSVEHDRTSHQQSCRRNEGDCGLENDWQYSTPLFSVLRAEDLI